MNEPTIKNMAEFAQLSGLSRPTISKYFDDPTSVRPSTRAQIERALGQYDYRPNFFAVNLNRRRPKILGLIVPDLADPFYVRLVQIIEARANAAGIFLLVLSSRGEAKLEAHAIETLLSLKVAGAILAPLGRGSEAALVDNLQARIPLVFLDSRLDDTAPFVGNDNAQSVPLITEYLCRTGEPPTFFEAPHVNHNSAERREAYVATMERLGLQPEFVTVPARRDWRFEALGFSETERALDGVGFPTRTILCANDRIATGVMAAAFQHGLKVGRGPDADLRIAGHDDQPLSRYTCPPLTTIAQDFEQLGARALDLLLDRVADDGRGPAEQVRLDARLVMRQSA
jgi:DNA-binding LacI/PurR family transcriptional regulator